MNKEFITGLANQARWHNSHPLEDGKSAIVDQKFLIDYTACVLGAVSEEIVAFYRELDLEQGVLLIQLNERIEERFYGK